MFELARQRSWFEALGAIDVAVGLCRIFGSAAESPNIIEGEQRQMKKVAFQRLLAANTILYFLEKHEGPAIKTTLKVQLPFHSASSIFRLNLQ